MFSLGFRKPPEERADFLRHYTGNWVWRTVSALIEDEQECSLDYFTGKINASETEITDALVGLEKLGIIRRTRKGYKKILKYVNFSDRNLDPAKILSDHIQVTSHVINQVISQDREKSFYRTSFVGTTEKKFREFTVRLEALLKDFLIESSQAKPERVFALSITATETTKTHPEERSHV